MLLLPQLSGVGLSFDFFFTIADRNGTLISIDAHYLVVSRKTCHTTNGSFIVVHLFLLSEAGVCGAISALLLW
jgi:hypothetical protein